MGRFHYLKPPWRLILVFVGAKMALADVYEIPLYVSLAVIVVTVAVAAAASLARPVPPTPRRTRAADAHRDPQTVRQQTAPRKPAPTEGRP